MLKVISCWIILPSTYIFVAPFWSPYILFFWWDLHLSWSWCWRYGVAFVSHPRYRLVLYGPILYPSHIFTSAVFLSIIRLNSRRLSESLYLISSPLLICALSFSPLSVIFFVSCMLFYLRLVILICDLHFVLLEVPLIFSFLYCCW